MTAFTLMLLGVLASIELTGGAFAKQFGNHGRIRDSLSALLCAAAASICWQYMLRLGVPLGSGGVLYGVTLALGMLVMGTVIYREKLTPIKLIGAACGIVALVLLAL